MTEPFADPDVRARRRLLAAMPKAELHLHLDGSLRIDTALGGSTKDDADEARPAGRETFGMHVGPIVKALGAFEHALTRCNPNLGKAVEGAADRGRRKAQMLGKLAKGRHPRPSLRVQTGLTIGTRSSGGATGKYRIMLPKPV